MKRDDVLKTIKGAEECPGNAGVIKVPLEVFHQTAEALRNDPQSPMDFLRDIVGMDWGEEGLGAVYFMESTATGEQIALRTATADRETPLLPTVSDLWKTALIKEREVYDFFGIRFTGHPDMRRLFLREDWIGWPLRKDYDMNSNPLRLDNEINADFTKEYRLRKDGTLEGIDHRIFGENDFVVNMGPQHPSTHGALRMRIGLDGEVITKVDPVLGYIHRGIEQRIDSHLLFYSCLVLDMGAMTPFFYGFREREMILDIFEETTGGRLIQHYNLIGGVQDDIHPTFCQKVKEFIAHLKKVLPDYHRIFTGNVIADTRLKGVGILSKEDAISLGCTGGTGRAAGWKNDVRKRMPYGVYDKVDFKEITYDTCDSFARYMVRMDEIVESCRIIEQLIDNIPEGEYRVKTKPIIKLPEGIWTSAVEASRGEFGVMIESRGDKTPYRMHFRSTGLPLVQAMDTLCRGWKFADLIAIGASVDFVIPDIDR